MPTKLILYFTAGSPPARACLLLARYLKLDVELREVNLTSGEQFNKEFKKLNPLAKVPVLIDGDFVLSESRAIMAYLISTRKAGSDLYPTDPKARALVDQRLYYDATNVFIKLAALVRPSIFFGIKTVSKESKDDVREVLKMLNSFLEGSEYFAGKTLTIADISIVTSVASFYEMGFNLTEYPDLNKWFERMHSLPSFDENQAGAKGLADLVRSLVDGTIY